MPTRIAYPGLLLAVHLSLALPAASAANAPATAGVAAPALPVLRDELLQMKARDQEVRLKQPPDFATWREVDAANHKRIKEIVARHGWPTFSMVGKDGARAAWLLVQHADEDKPFQRDVLAMMEPLVRQGQASAVDYAYLYDRTHYPQRYGTQGSCVSSTEWQPFQTEAPESLDQRRRELGLPSMAQYAERFKEGCADPHTALHSPDDARKTMPLPTP